MSYLKKNKFENIVLDDVIRVIKAIGIDGKIENAFWKKYIGDLKLKKLDIKYLNLFLDIKDLYFLIHTSKIKLNNETLVLLSKILNCLLLLKANDIVYLKSEIINAEKNLVRIKKGNLLDKEYFLNSLKFDSIYSQCEKVLFLINKIVEMKNNSKN